MTQANTTIEHLGAEYFSDPYSVHARLRAEHPVAQVIMPGGTPAWLITGYTEGRAALTDPRLLKMPKGWRPDPDSWFASLDMHMLNSDPPDHERLRKLVNKVFTARRVEQLRPRITAITAALLDDMSAQQEVDLLTAFAFPLPVTVICELLGVPVADRDQFRAWSATIVSETVSSEVSQAHFTAMIGYFRDLLAVRRREPADDLLSALISARDEGDRLSENELLSMAWLLLVAGHETTVNLIGSGVLALLLHPGELARLRADPALLGGAVEELLRYVSPVNDATLPFRGEPGPVPLRRPGGAGRRPGQPRAPGVRSRHPLLRGRAAGPAGGRDRVRRAARAVRLDNPGRARGGATLAPQLPHPRPGIPAGAAAPRRLSGSPRRSAPPRPPRIPRPSTCAAIAPLSGPGSCPWPAP